jgi:hypothetical protein
VDYERARNTMSGYYFHLAVRCLRGNVALTVLIIAAVGVGIGATMTVLTVLLARPALRAASIPPAVATRAQ